MLGLFVLSSFSKAVATLPSKPNVIVVYTDDHGWPDVGSVGVYPDLKTPNIDRLAKGGLRAVSGYSTAPQCVPSRAGLLSGRSQNRFGVESNGESLEGFDRQFTIAERLKKVGYATGQIGKWHLGPVNAITSHGFDDVYAKNANRPGWANYTLDGKTVPGGQENSRLYHLDACSEAARAFIERHEKEPFFLYLAYRAPHVPLDAPAKYLNRFPGEMPERRRQALAMISAMDDGLGLIHQTLQEKGLLEKTLIFVIADNGAPLKIHKLDAPGGGPGWDGSLNEPMNGEKGMLSEGGMRVPFIVSWPGIIPGGQVYEHPIWTLDVAATAVTLAGLPMDGSLDGVNLIPYLSGEKKEAPHGQLFWRWISQSAVREGKWKFLKGGDREYLFNLDQDKEEKHDLKKEHPQVAARLKASLSKWAGELDPPGLVTKPMSQTWEDYFDHYLDGKPPAPLRSKFVPKENGQTTDLQGWVVRNGVAKTGKDGLKVAPEVKKGRRLYMARAKIKHASPVKVRISLQAAKGDKVGVSWREEGQKDFVAGQTVSSAIQDGTGHQEALVSIPNKAEVIHIRVHLPDGETVLESIEVVGRGGSRDVWRFRE